MELMLGARLLGIFSWLPVSISRIMWLCIKEFFACIFFFIFVSRVGGYMFPVTGGFIVPLIFVLFQFPFLNPVATLAIFSILDQPVFEDAPDGIPGWGGTVMQGVLCTLLVVFQVLGSIAGGVFVNNYIDDPKYGDEKIDNGLMYKKVDELGVLHNGKWDDASIVFDEAFAVWAFVVLLRANIRFHAIENEKQKATVKDQKFKFVFDLPIFFSIGLSLVALTIAFPSAYVGTQALVATWARMYFKNHPTDHPLEGNWTVGNFYNDILMRLIGQVVGLILGCVYVIGTDFKLGKDYNSAYPGANITMADEVKLLGSGGVEDGGNPPVTTKAKYSFLDSELLHRRI